MAVLVLLLAREQWAPSAFVATVLIFYVLVVRRTRCRVETNRHWPCRWRVRGLLGCCDYHLGYKRGLPKLVSAGRFSLPMFMWPRPNLSMVVSEVEPQPSAHAVGATADAPRARESSLDTVMVWLGVVGLAVALASFLRDLIAG